MNNQHCLSIILLRGSQEIPNFTSWDFKQDQKEHCKIMNPSPLRGHEMAVGLNSMNFNTI